MATDNDTLLGMLAEIEATVERRQEALRMLFDKIGDAAKCDGCGAMIYFVRHKNGKLAPYNPDAVSHFATCQFAGEFRRK
jgi:hypothetical protein